MRIWIWAVLACAAILVVPIPFVAVVALLAIVLWKIGKGRAAAQMVFMVAIMALTYWMMTLTVLMLANYEAYIVVIALCSLVAIVSGASWAMFNVVFRYKS